MKSAVQPADTIKFKLENNLSTGKKHLFFGQIKETKGLDLLLEAFANAGDACDLIIAGRMRRHSFDKYQEIIDRYDLKNRLSYLSVIIRLE